MSRRIFGGGLNSKRPVFYLNIEEDFVLKGLYPSNLRKRESEAIWFTPRMNGEDDFLLSLEDVDSLVNALEKRTVGSIFKCCCNTYGRQCRHTLEVASDHLKIFEIETLSPLDKYSQDFVYYLKMTQELAPLLDRKDLMEGYQGDLFTRVGMVS